MADPGPARRGRHLRHLPRRLVRRTRGRRNPRPLPAGPPPARPDPSRPERCAAARHTRARPDPAPSGSPHRFAALGDPDLLAFSGPDSAKNPGLTPRGATPISFRSVIKNPSRDAAHLKAHPPPDPDHAATIRTRHPRLRHEAGARPRCPRSQAGDRPRHGDRPGPADRSRDCRPASPAPPPAAGTSGSCRSGCAAIRARFQAAPGYIAGPSAVRPDTPPSPRSRTSPPRAA